MPLLVISNTLKAIKFEQNLVAFSVFLYLIKLDVLDTVKFDRIELSID